MTDKSRKLTQLFSQATPLTGSTPFHSTNARTPPVFVLRASTTRATAQRPSRISLLPACSWAHLSRLATLTRDRLSTSTTTFRPTAANGNPDNDPLSLHARMRLACSATALAATSPLHCHHTFPQPSSLLARSAR